MFSFIWPVALVVLSNVFYHICAKSMPQDVNPLASLTITYLVGALVSGVLYCITNRGGNLLAEYQKVNWTSFILGLAIIGLEFGVISAYKNGWQVGVFSIVQSSALTSVLIIVGYFAFREAVTWNKLLGIVICIAGIWVINLK